MAGKRVAINPLVTCGTCDACVGGRPNLCGSRQIISMMPRPGAFAELVTIFIRPTDLAELERRLRSRGTESEEAVGRRLNVARRELQQADRYQYQVVNDTVPAAVEEISNILESRGLCHD